MNHMISVVAAKEKAQRIGATGTVEGDRLRFYQSGEDIGSTLIDRGMVSRHSVEKILKDRPNLWEKD